MTTTLATIGHGTSSAPELVHRLRAAGIALLVDVRRFPGSRAHPDLARESLETVLPEAGIEYRWEPRLGGRRHLVKDADAASPDTWWRVAAFRAYAARTRSDEFDAGLDDVLAEAARRRTAVMCSEFVWWRCHRRVIADVAALARGARVVHVMPDGALSVHEPSPGARRVEGPGGRVHLVWDGADAGAPASAQRPPVVPGVERAHEAEGRDEQEDDGDAQRHRDG